MREPDIVDAFGDEGQHRGAQADHENAVGKPLIYATSKSFMDYFGINSAEDLPKIPEVLMEELVQATNVQEAMDADAEETEENVEEAKILAVTVEGRIIEEQTDINDNELGGES